MGRDNAYKIRLVPEAARVAERFPSKHQAINASLIYWGEKHPEGSPAQYRIYFEPKDGAQGNPHYSDETYGSIESAQQAIEEREQDHLNRYWRMSVRMV